jgi:hypothetical protein
LSAHTWFPQLINTIKTGQFRSATLERSCLNVEPLEATLLCDGFTHVEQFMRLRRA